MPIADPKRGATLAVEKYGKSFGLDQKAQELTAEKLIPLVATDETKKNGLFTMSKEGIDANIAIIEVGRAVDDSRRALRHQRDRRSVRRKDDALASARATMVDVPKDPWVRVKTEHDFNADEVVSAFQKSIRRGMLENALLLAYEMYVTSAELEEHLWTRLTVISVEDVGSGSFLEPVIVDALYRMHQRFSARRRRSLPLRRACRATARDKPEGPHDRRDDQLGDAR